MEHFQVNLQAFMNLHKNQELTKTLTAANKWNIRHKTAQSWILWKISIQTEKSNGIITALKMK